MLFLIHQRRESRRKRALSRAPVHEPPPNPHTGGHRNSRRHEDAEDAVALKRHQRARRRTLFFERWLPRANGGTHAAPATGNEEAGAGAGTGHEAEAGAGGNASNAGDNVANASTAGAAHIPIQGHPMRHRHHTGLHAGDRAFASGAFGTLHVCSRNPDAVVIKRVKLARRPGGPLASPEFGEVRSLLATRSCPHVVALLSWCSSDGVLELALERCHLGDLHGFVQRARGPLPPQQVRAITRDVAHGIRQLHRQGIIHCDIKPANILLTRAHGRLVAKIGDLGSAIDAPGGCDSHGTARYQAPEAIVGDTRCKSDVFGAGASVFYMAAGAHPFSACRGEALAAYYWHMGLAYSQGQQHSSLLQDDVGSHPGLGTSGAAALITAWTSLQLDDRPGSEDAMFLGHPFIAGDDRPRRVER